VLMTSTPCHTDDAATARGYVGLCGAAPDRIAERTA